MLINVAMSASDSDEVPVDVAQDTKGSEDLKNAEGVPASEGLTGTQKLIGIAMVFAVCYGIAKYNSGKPTHNVGYEKTQA